MNDRVQKLQSPLPGSLVKSPPSIRYQGDPHTLGYLGTYLGVGSSIYKVYPLTTPWGEGGGGKGSPWSTGSLILYHVDGNVQEEEYLFPI